MAVKSFKTPTRRDPIPFEIDDATFHINPNVPGAVLVDFMAGMDEDNAGAMAEMVAKIFDEIILDTDLERFKTYIRDPKNNVSLELLTELCGYFVEELSGNGERPDSYGPG